MGEERWFRPSAPVADLAGVLACRWDATVAGRHDLVPDGSVELLWIEGRGLRVCGPDTTGWTFTLPSGTACSGLRFRPGAVGRVFGEPARGLVDRQLPVGDLLGGRTERVLDEAVSSAAGGRARLEVLEQFLRGRLRDARDDPMAYAAALLSRAGRRARLTEVADQLGVSTRQFRRRFAESVGYSPAFYARIVRLQRFMERAARRPGDGLAVLAAETGYTDQAHLAHDCRDLAGMTPRRLVANLSRTSAASVP